MDDKRRLRLKRHQRVRAKVHGTAARPRLAVFRSLKHIYVQLIDDDKGHTVSAASTHEPAFRSLNRTGGDIEAAKIIGKTVAERAKQTGVDSVVFDRGGFRYHGRVQALADAAREAGLQF